MSEQRTPSSTQHPLKQQPTQESREAIARFVKDGTWPQPGLLPVCVRLPRRLGY